VDSQDPAASAAVHAIRTGTPPQRSSGAKPARRGAEDFQGSLGTAATDPHAGSGHNRVCAAAEGAGPVAAPVLSGAAVTARHRSDRPCEFLLDRGGVNAEVGEDAAG